MLISILISGAIHLVRAHGEGGRGVVAAYKLGGRSFKGSNLYAFVYKGKETKIYLVRAHREGGRGVVAAYNCVQRGKDEGHSKSLTPLYAKGRRPKFI